jgi:transcriptional regulator with XRE-family HTH domain
MDKGFDQLRKVLATNVRMYRRAKSLSQEELAFEADIDRTYVSQIERSIINPSLLILFRVGQALDVTVQDLLAVPDISKPKKATSTTLMRN